MWIRNFESTLFAFDELSLQRGEIPFYITQQLMRDCLGKKENRQTDRRRTGGRGPKGRVKRRAVARKAAAAAAIGDDGANEVTGGGGDGDSN